MPPLKVRAARALTMAVALQALFVFFFVFPAHEPKPNDLPVAVVGETARLPGDFDVHRVGSREEAEELIRDREVYGAITGDERIVASAASLPAAQLISLGHPSRDVVPLVRDDPRGVTLNLLVLPLTITAILLALIAGGLLPDIDTRRRAGLAALAGVLGGSMAIGLVNGWLNALPGPALSEIGLIAVAVLGIGLTSAGIVRIVGPAGTVLPFLLFLMLGNPASGLASAPELLPTPWAEAGPFLPPGALGSGLRGIAYFDGAGTLMALIVLLGWCALGLGLNAVADRRASQGSDP